MQLNIQTAQDSDKARYVSVIRWCRKHRQLLDGVPFDDQPVGKGINMDFLVPPGVTDDTLQRAYFAGCAVRNVVSHRVLICPLEWFIEASETRFCEDTFHDFVVSHGFGAPTAQAKTLGVLWLWLGYTYAEIAAEVVFRGLCTGSEE